MEKRNSRGLTESEFLEAYNPGDYERPSVTVDMLVFSLDREYSTLKVLLIKRKDHPYIDCWALPGGFIDINESAYEAANRELREETGLENIYLEQLYTLSKPNRDPRMRVIDISYIALIQHEVVTAGDDASEALWFDLTFVNTALVLFNKEKDIRIEYKLEEKVFNNGKIQIKNYIPILDGEEKLAFDHADILLEGLMRLRNKVEYTDIAFNLVPDIFTLPDLQRVYETILGKALYKANFRDYIKNKVLRLDYKIKSAVGNKSQAYKYKALEE